MIEITCRCGAALEAAENDLNAVAQCGSCGMPITYLCGESLPEGAGTGDFDLALTCVRGPDRVDEQFSLGGVADIEVGKSEGKHLRLTGGGKVSRAHCKFVRVDFGPSRWELQDNKSTNGIFVNGQRVEHHTVKPGDKIIIGDYLFEARDAAPVPVAVTAADASPVASGPPKHPCPKCGAGLPSAKAVFCTNCGTDLKSGKRALLSKDLDEDAIHIRAENTMMFISWIIPFGIFPIASEALGTKKPLTTWIITGFTALCSVAFMIAYNSGADDIDLEKIENVDELVALLEDNTSPALENLMLWSGDPQLRINELKADSEYSKDDEAELRNRIKAEEPSITEAALKKQVEEEKAGATRLLESVIERDGEIGFRWYQLVTHAFLHDASSWIGLILHFVGNLLFLLVFGMRVNELVGQWRFAVSYILLAIGAGLAHHFMSTAEYPHPMVGASGAIMGLAGMYLVLFPLQKVFMAFWIRLGLLTGFRRISHVWKMPGIWLLVMWIAWNDLLPMLLRYLLPGYDDSVAHWAHLGGFVTGIFLAIIWLLTRQVHAHGGDLISRMIGPSAGKFIRQN